MKGKVLLFAVLAGFLLLTIVPGAFAAENVAELKIESITSPIVSGETLEFSYIVGNRIGPPCSAKIEYWFESRGKRVIQGNDSIYLETGEKKAESASLIMLPGLEGVRKFFLEMECNDANILASRMINISTGIPKLPLFNALDVLEKEDGQQLVFSYVLESPQDSPAPVMVEERVIMDGNVLWANSQKIAVAGSTEIKRLGLKLLPGSYKLVAQASNGSETAMIEREFSVVAVPPAVPIAAIGALALLMFAVIFVAIKFLMPARTRRDQVFPAELPAEEGPAALAKTVCAVETEASGMLDHSSLDKLLDEADLPEAERARAFEIATAVPTVQAVKSCIFTDEDGKMSFETAVTNTLINNSNRDWRQVLVIARIPSFLEGNYNVSADTKMDAREENSLLWFTLGRVGAKQSATIVYTVPKLISREEATQVSFPAVVGFKEAKRLKLKKVRLKKKARKKSRRKVKKTVRR